MTMRQISVTELTVDGQEHILRLLTDDAGGWRVESEPGDAANADFTSLPAATGHIASWLVAITIIHGSHPTNTQPRRRATPRHDRDQAGGKPGTDQTA
ncbi:MAG: hypothetical protein HOV83_41740 [Catenulispora sp.]|nr:hypothetical protein [Catenulispora sp.]